MNEQVQQDAYAAFIERLVRPTALPCPATETTWITYPVEPPGQYTTFDHKERERRRKKEKARRKARAAQRRRE